MRDQSPSHSGQVVYLTPVQVAARFHITVGTLANWRSLGTGPSFIRIGKPGGRGGRVLYALDSLLAWESSQRNACSLTTEGGKQ